MLDRLAYYKGDMLDGKPRYAWYTVGRQVDPIKPTLKAPGTKRLNLLYDKPLSNFAFKFNLRRYNTDSEKLMTGIGATGKIDVKQAGAYTRPLFGST
jgi:hypothetical protein